MNYLAHALLSGNNPDLLVGNFIADHIRGNNLSFYPKQVIEGIFLHRKIDTYTDAHPLFKESKRLFYKDFEKHSGILIDIYFDHFLAKNFERYSEISLDTFSEHVYTVYSAHRSILPADSSRFLEYVIKNNVYKEYAKLSGIEVVLYHLSQRIKHGVRLDESLSVFKEHEPRLQKNFDIFFKDIQEEFSDNQQVL